MKEYKIIKTTSEINIFHTIEMVQWTNKFCQIQILEFNIHKAIGVIRMVVVIKCKLKPSHSGKLN